MRKLATITLAAMVALTGAASTASAALSSGDAPVIRQAKETQVAARGGGRNERSGNRESRRGDRKGKPIWRIKDRKHRERPFFLFRGRGDCEYVRAVQPDGSLGKTIRVCN